MNYARVAEFMDKFDADNYELVTGIQAHAETQYAEAAATNHYRNLINPAGYSHVYGKLYPNETGAGNIATYRYKSGDVYREVGFYLVEIVTAALGAEGFAGPMCTRANVNGKDRIFAIKGGGLGDFSETAKMQYVCEGMLVDDIFEPVQKAFGIELLDKVSQEAKDWVRVYQNVANMHNGYEELVDGEIVTHQPFDYPDFNNVADNIYIRMCINDSNLVEDFFKSTTNADIIGKNENDEPITNGCWVNCYVDPYAGKTYFPYGLLQLFSNIIDGQGGFATSDTSYEPDRNWNVGPKPTYNKKHWYIGLGPSSLTTDAAWTAWDNLLSGKIAGRPAVMKYNSLTSDGDGGIVIGYTTLYCSDNNLIGRTYDASNYRYFNNETPGVGYGGPWTKYSFRGTISKDGAVMLTRDDSATGTIREIDGDNFLSATEYSHNIGYGKASNLIGTKPSTPSNIHTSYPDWYDSKEDLIVWNDAHPEDYGELGYYLLPLSMGADAGEGKTQQDVWGGTTEGKDVDDDGTSEKAVIADDGETIDGPEIVGMGSGFFHLYYTSAGSIQDVYTKALQNDDLGDLIAKFYAGDLSKAILDVYRLPFICDSTDRQEIKLSNVTLEGIEGYEQHNRIHTIDFGTISIARKFEDQRDYSPITRASIYLPFSGYQNLDVDDIMGAQVKLRCKVDKMSGNGIYEIKVIRDDMDAILYTFPMSCRLEYPISFNQSRTLFSSALSAAGAAAVVSGGAGYTIGLSQYAVGKNYDGDTTFAKQSDSMRLGLPDSKLARSAASAASTLGALNMLKPVQARGGQIGNASGWLASMVPYIIINRPNYGEPENFESLIGIAANTDVVLGNVHGRTVVREVRLEGISRATSQELEDLRSILMSGAIL